MVSERIETRILPATAPETPLAAARALRQGQLVVFPTDTVYGIGVDPFQPAALARLYAAKGRSAEKGIPILISDRDQLARLSAAPPSPAVQRLLDQFWPGALTVIVPRHPALPAVIAPGDTIAVRMPDCAAALAVIRAAGGAVATTSANRSDEPPALSGDAAARIFAGRAAVIVDDGPVTGGTPSTILDCTVEPFRVVRAGPLRVDDLLTAAGLS